MKIFVTGSAGFIGFHVAKKLVARGEEVVGLDNINDYYDQKVKFGRLKEAGFINRDVFNNSLTELHSEVPYGKPVSSISCNTHRFVRLNLEDKDAVYSFFKKENFDAVCHLAAQGGVRYSIKNPMAYIQSNIVGFIHVLEACRHYGVKNLCYASSSSVYGLNSDMPFSTRQNVDHPISLYAATKKSNELMAHSYSHLYNISTTGLRFFTVYGPWGRPDMAYFRFVKSAIEGEAIDVYNNGDMMRDFTYIDDIVEGVIRVIEHPATSNQQWKSGITGPSSSTAPYKIYNIGNNAPVRLMDFITAIEKKIGNPIKKNFLPLQAGDVTATYADVEDLIRDFEFKPCISIEEGISRFVDWYMNFFNIKHSLLKGVANHG